MRATTVKLDKKILTEISSVKPPEQTLTAFVRETLEYEVRQRKLREAACQYRKLLEKNPKLREEAEEWRDARLEQPSRKQP